MILGAAALKSIVAVAEEHEVACVHPVEQVRRLAHLGGGERWRITLQSRDDLAHALTHAPPVAHRGAHIGEGLLEIILQPPELHGIRDAVDLVQLPGLRTRGLRAVGTDVAERAAALAPHLQHRMHDQVDRELGARKGHTE